MLGINVAFIQFVTVTITYMCNIANRGEGSLKQLGVGNVFVFSPLVVVFFVLLFFCFCYCDIFNYLRFVR